MCSTVSVANPRLYSRPDSSCKGNYENMKKPMKSGTQCPAALEAV